MAIWYGQWPVPSSPTGSDSAASTDAPGASEGWISPRALCSPKTRTAATDWAVSSPTLLTLTCAESAPSRGSTTGAIEMLMLPAAAGPTRQSASAGAPTRTSCRWCLIAARRLAQLQAAENRRRASVADQAGPAARAAARPGVEAAPAAGAGLAGRRVAEQDRHHEREIGERGPEREAVAPGGAVPDRDQAAEPERLPGAHDLARLELAAGRAAVPRHGVAVVALLARIDDAVPAARLALAGRRAAVARDRVAVVALLAGVEDVVAAHLEPAVRRAAVARDGVAVVALLARFEHTVAAVAGRRETARRRHRAADLGAHRGAEYEVDVGEAAAAQVAVAHDGPARADDRPRVAAGLLVVALVDRRAVAVGVGRAEVVADLVGHHQHVPDLRRVGEVEVAVDLRHPEGVARITHRADVGDPALHALAGDEVDQGVRPGDRVHVVGRVGPVVAHLVELLVGRGGAPGIGRRRPEADVGEAQAHAHVALVDRRGGGGERRQVVERPRIRAEPGPQLVVGLDGGIGLDQPGGRESGWGRH